MRKTPVTQDAQLLLQLDRLQKESEMRKARLWWRDRFWPQNAADYIMIEMVHGSRESDWLRQVTTFWGMAASLVLDGTLSEKAFSIPHFPTSCLQFSPRSSHSSRTFAGAPITRILWPTWKRSSLTPRSAGTGFGWNPSVWRNAARSAVERLRFLPRDCVGAAIREQLFSIRRSPLPRGSKQLQPDGELIIVHGHAIHHSRPRSEVPQQGTHVQALVGFPRLAGQNSRPPGTDVFRDSLLRGRAHVQTGEIDVHLHGCAILGALRSWIHIHKARYLPAKPLMQSSWRMSGRGAATRVIITPYRPAPSRFHDRA